MLQFSGSSGLAKQEDFALSKELNFNFPISCRHNYSFLCTYFIFCQHIVIQLQVLGSFLFPLVQVVISSHFLLLRYV